MGLGGSGGPNPPTLDDLPPIIDPVEESFRAEIAQNVDKLRNLLRISDELDNQSEIPLNTVEGANDYEYYDYYDQDSGTGIEDYYDEDANEPADLLADDYFTEGVRRRAYNDDVRMKGKYVACGVIRVFCFFLR